jgi:AraC family transcriptional regulator
MKPAASPITLGLNLGRLEAGGFVLTETSHSPERMLPRHFHESANIIFVVEGSFIERFDGRACECDSHSLLFKPAGEPHADRFGRQGMRCLVLEVPPARAALLGPAGGALDRVRHVPGGRPPQIAARIYREFLSPDAFSALAIEALTLELMVEASRRGHRSQGGRVPPWLAQARAVLHEQSSHGLRLSAVAQLVGVHPVHLAREFRRRFGCTPGDYLRRVRVDAAARQLAGSDASIAEIAGAAGFSHQAHFCRVFKRQTGMPPSAYRRAHRSR